MMSLVRLQQTVVLWTLCVCTSFAFAHVAFAQQASPLSQQPQVYSVGVAKVDITPDYPVRLNGFLVRKQESIGVRQQIWAKAIAIGQQADAAVLITVDALGIPDQLTATIAKRLQQKVGLNPARLAITASHTHTAPMINGCAPNIFGEPIPPDAQAHIDRYTQEFTDKLEQAALDALKDRRDSTLHWGIGLVSFAKNRRDKNGPFDHDLPMLVVRDLQSQVRAIYVSYACHCVTLSEPRIGGDWAGFAQVQIEKRYPKAIALTSVGCAGDQNPSTGVVNDRADLAQAQGEEIAVEVDRLLSTTLRPVNGPLTIVGQELQLPLDTLPTRADFERLAQQNTPTGFHARVQLAKLDRGEKLREQISYPVQSWAFGDSLAMVFLAGEVVSEYGLRLKNELDGRKLWVNAYANACPGYIPSERVLKAGGYEGGGAMIYYDQPTRFAPGLEQPIIDAALGQLKKTFPPQLAPNKGQGTRPRSPEQSLKLLRTRSDMQVELVVAEPLVTSPVAVDFGPDGKIWVAEMFDYPAGTDGTYGPGGRVRVLTRSNDNQLVDTSTIFLDGIPFPTGITVWRKGVLIAAAPDILYAEDSDNDGRADIVRKLYSGFGTDNYQARVNSLEYGLDGWVYGSCGLFGGSIKSFASDQPFELGNRDFRIQPDTGAIEVAAGLTQQGRVRDDFGNWFGCDNSQLGRHYPLAMHYASRNPYAPPPAGAVPLPATAADATLVPANPALQLFKLSGGSGIATAACGIGIYRDNLLGDSFQGNIFTCEPVNLLVHRLQLTPRGSSFAGTRAADELQQEFLSSTDTWFRPVQVRTAPDGSLWVLDMYRFVIEHPRWIPPESLDQIDTRAGAGMGRIYSVRPRESSSAQGISAGKQSWPRLDKLSPEQLVAALDSSNGWQRDMAMQLLVWNKESSRSQASVSLKQLLRRTNRPETRVQVLATLDQLQTLSDDDVLLALQDDHAGVRRHGLRLSEAFAAQGTTTSQTMLALAVELARTDSNGQVRLQAACSLGAWKNAPTAAAALADIVLAAPQDAHLRSAVMSSLTKKNVAAFTQQLLGGPPTALAQAAPSLLPLALTMSDSDAAFELLNQVAQLTERQGQVAWSWNTLAAMLGQLTKRADAMKALPTSSTYIALQNATSRARQLLQAADTTVSVRAAAMAILSRPELGLKEAPDAVSDLQILSEFLNPKHSASEQLAAANAMLRGQQPSIANVLLTAWKQMSPQLKATVLDGLLTRDAWVAALLDALESKQVDAAELDAARRQQLLSHGDARLKARAEKLLAGKLNPDRLAVLDSYATVTELKGDEQRGAELFRKNCSTCHRLRDTGAAVGPDLTALASKPVNFFLQEILDPNRNLDSRYMSYTALTDSGRTLTGLLAAETATAITLRGAEAKEESLQRSEIEQLSSTRASLMPEGLEKILPPQAMADVITFVKASAVEPVPPESMAVGELARDMLTESLPNETRLNLVPMAALSASDVITAMAANMPANAQEEYRRIPWIWRVAVAAGKNGDAQQLKKVIEVSLPRDGTQLRDWQAVVIGGGVINGLGLRGDWPAARINQMLEGDERLQLKWRELIAASQRMADNQQVRTGTRYDALRIVALAPWPAPEAQLRKYIGREVDAELQMGSVSGLADIDHPEATNLLVEYLPQFAPENRRLAIVALAHGTPRQRELIKLLESGQVKPNEVAAPQRESLLLSTETDIAQSAKRLLGVQKP